MRKIIACTNVSLDGVMQAPARSSHRSGLGDATVWRIRQSLRAVARRQQDDFAGSRHRDVSNAMI